MDIFDIRNSNQLQTNIAEQLVGFGGYSGFHNMLGNNEEQHRRLNIYRWIGGLDWIGSWIDKYCTALQYFSIWPQYLEILRRQCCLGNNEEHLTCGCVFAQSESSNPWAGHLWMVRPLSSLKNKQTQNWIQLLLTCFLAVIFSVCPFRILNL